MIQSVDRAIRMLLELQGARHLGLSELAKRLDLSPSTTHGLIRTLTARDLVRQDSQTQRYHLGPAVLRLAGVYLEALELRTHALSRIKELVSITDSAVRLGVLSGNEVILVHHETPTNHPNHMAELGIGVPAHSSSLGKAILAFEPDDAMDNWDDPLPTMTSSTITTIADLREELITVRNDGVAFEREESIIGESTVASPIFGSGNKVLGAVAVVLSTYNLETLEAAAKPTLAAAQAISRQLGAAAYPAGR